MAELSAEQKDIAARLFNHLVTPSGTKIAHDVSDLADFARAPVRRALARARCSPAADPALARGGRRTSATRSSTTSSPQPVLAWRAEHEADRELEAQKRDVRPPPSPTARASSVSARSLLAAMGARDASTRSRSARKRASRRGTAKANGLVVECRRGAGSRSRAEPPARARGGAKSLGRARRAIAAASAARSRVRGVVDVGAPLLDAVPRGDAVLAVTEDGAVVVTTAAAATSSTRSRPVSRRRMRRSPPTGRRSSPASDGRVRIVREDGSVDGHPGRDRRARGLDLAGRVASPSSSSPIERGSSSRRAVALCTPIAIRGRARPRSHRTTDAC